MRSRIALIVALISVSSYHVAADVRTQQKTQVQFAGMLGRMMNLFGGKAAREGITSSVAVKGDRKVTSSDNTSQIIDLAEEKVYDIDLRKKSYKVTTFAELRRQMEEAQRKAAENAGKNDERTEPRQPSGTEAEAEVEVDFDVKNTGATKAIHGFDTRQSIVSVTVRQKGKTLEEGGGMVLTSDMWLAPDQPAMKEVAEFDRRHAQKLYGGLIGVSADQMAAAMALYPMLRQAITRMNAEGSKVEGTAILTTLTFDAVKSADQQATEAPPEAKPSGLGGVLGGLAKRVRKNDDAAKPRTTFMTSTVEVLSMSPTVTAADVAIPEGFKESK